MSNLKKMKFGQYDFAAFSGYVAYASCAMVLSVVLIPLAKSLDFPLDQGNLGAGGALHLCRSIAMFCTMLCCAFLAGRFGKRLSLGGALLVIGTGFLCAAAAPAYGWLVCAVILSALGQGVFEVLVTPSIQELHEKEEPARYINVTHAFWSVGVVCVVLFAGWALGIGISWRGILFIVGLLAFLPGVLFLIPSAKQRFSSGERRDPKTVWMQMKRVLKVRRFWIFLACMLLAGGGEHCLSFWVPSFIRMEYHAAETLCGLGTAVFAVGMVGGRILSGVFGSRARMKKIILFSALGGMAFGVFPPLLHSLGFLYLLLFLLGFFTGPLWPSIQSFCVGEIEEDPTTMYVLLPCVGIPGCGLFTWLMGVAGDGIGFRNSFFLVPLCYLFLFLLVVAGSRKETVLDPACPGEKAY